MLADTKDIQYAIAPSLGNVMAKLVAESTPVWYFSIVLPTFSGGVLSFLGWRKSIIKLYDISSAGYTSRKKVICRRSEKGCRARYGKATTEQSSTRERCRSKAHPDHGIRTDIK